MEENVETTVVDTLEDNVTTTDEVNYDDGCEGPSKGFVAGLAVAATALVAGVVIAIKKHKKKKLKDLKTNNQDKDEEIVEEVELYPEDFVDEETVESEEVEVEK